jgi:hypothetical protein
MAKTQLKLRLPGLVKKQKMLSKTSERLKKTARSRRW